MGLAPQACPTARGAERSSRARPRGETVLWRERLARSRQERDSREYIAFGADAEQREGRRQYRLIVCACGARALHEAQAVWRAARMRRSWIATTIANRVKPTISAVVVGYTSASPATINITRSIHFVRPNSQPCTPPASEAMPNAAVTLTTAIEPQSAFPRVLIE